MSGVAGGTKTASGSRTRAGNESALKKARTKAHHKAAKAHPHGVKKKHKVKHHHRKRHHKRRKVVKHVSGLAGAPAPLPIAVNPPAPSSVPPPSLGAPITLPQAHRLLWRAGFGPTPGQAEALAGQPIEAVIHGMTRPSGAAVLHGPAATDDEGNALAPADEWGQDHCWWLDRMVRSDQQLIERMTFIWHDWFANSNEKVGSQQRMLDQNQLFRENALSSFHDLFMAVTVNPAMLVFLDGIYNDKWEPNENYAREMMELFSLGADRGAYTETDVREMARALTGWTATWTESSGLQNFRFEASRHDTGNKTIFGQTGKWTWEDAVRLCVTHPLHASFFIGKLWSYFVPNPPDEATLASLQGLYIGSGYSIRAVVEAILQHPEFLNGPELVTPPVVYNAGLLRAIGRPIDTTAWAWLSAGAGQQLFYPPNVAGWDFTHWLDTSTAKARWEMASYVTAKTYANPWPPEGTTPYSATEEPAEALASAMAYWGEPQLSSESAQSITAFSQNCFQGLSIAKWEKSPYKAMRQNALRMLIATSPDLQVS
ncbi:MAG TPA: DUF1800 domain-containing protein [Solirubrobacteraceae bacterium]|jgi:uncharacterized protein (DUF1800 family)|nr:DUF1800 domain-containing protein [Solirubrobacteraceae bacterium]